MMIEESLENQGRLEQLITSASQQRSNQEQFELYQHFREFLSHKANKKQIPNIVHQLFRKIKGEKLFLALLKYISNRIIEETNPELQNSFVNSIIEVLEMKEEGNRDISLKKRKVSEVLIENQSNLMQKVIEKCKESQLRSKNLFRSLNEVLIDKTKTKSALGLTFTHSSLYALKILQFWQNSTPLLLQQALRHLLIVDNIQQGQILAIISENDTLLNNLFQMSQKNQGISGYLLFLISKLKTSSVTQNNQKILQLQEKTMQIIFKTVELGTDLSQQISNILFSELFEVEKFRKIQLIRSYCIFTAVFAKKQIKAGLVEDQLIQLLEQLMDIRDFLSFQSLVTQYSQILKIQPQRRNKLSSQVIQRIQRNCLPEYIEEKTLFHEQSSFQILFLEGKFQNTQTYKSSRSSSQAMQYLLDLILQERGCKVKPKVCPCFDSYIHATIQNQYDQMFNAHDFMSATNLICRESSRVLKMKPSLSELQNLKNYLFNYLKWLLNLNQSCLPQFRRCINLKIFDIILSFPYILYNNDFLQQVTEDLLVDRIPDTFFHLTELIQFMKKNMMNEDNQTKVQRIVEKILKKSSAGQLNFWDKINSWSLVFEIIGKKEEKLKEVLELYSLYDDHWMAKKYAAWHYKINLLESIRTKISQIQQKWQNNSQFFTPELLILRQQSQQK